MQKSKMEKMKEIDLIDFGEDNDEGRRRFGRLAKSRATVKQKTYRNWKLN